MDKLGQFLVGDSYSGGTAYLSWESICVGMLFVGLTVILSFVQNLGMGKAITVASIRTTVQLTFLGYLLVPCFEYPRWWASMLITGIMGCIAAREATVRTKYAYSGLYGMVWLSITIPSFSVLMMALTCIIPVHPFWTPQYFITLAGMLLNNCLNGISIGLSSFVTSVYENRGSVDHRLARGANRFEAVQPLVINAMQIGLMPTLNNMRVLGLVSIPGMMTGQILGGNPPEQAARYQMIIYFLICVSSSFGLLGALDLTREALFDHDHRLMVSSRLVPRQGKREDILTAAFHSIKDILIGFYHKCCKRHTYVSIDTD
jgi:putative ABC transport system permease protein